MEWSADGKLSTFLQPSGRANGMMFDAQGNLIACADEHNQLWSIAPDKTVTVLVTNFHGKYLNGPNDVWIAPNGANVSHRPVLQAHLVGSHDDGADRTRRFFIFRPTGKTLRTVTDDLKKPNGITGTPDGKNLFVSDIRADRPGATTSSPTVR